MEVETVKRISAADETFRTLHDMIISGRLKPGDKLPPQDKLARQFGVSRNTVREAMNKLTVMGLLNVRQGVGTLINISSPSAYMASLSDHLLLQPATVRDFMEARVIIEVANVHLAVMRADREAISELEINVRKQRDALRKGDVAAFIDLDVEFHTLLARASGNKVLMQFLETATDLLGKFIKEVVLLPRAVQNAFAFHNQIVKLLRSKDAEGAKLKIIEHLRDVVKNIERSTGIETGAVFPFDTSV
jgi:GntR family transcriptional repressor for pyruvate dehydrogenase complex